MVVFEGGSNRGNFGDRQLLPFVARGLLSLPCNSTQCRRIVPIWRWARAGSDPARKGETW